MASKANKPDTFTKQMLEMPAFRALLRSVEADFYEDFELPEPILDLGCGDGHFATIAFDKKLNVGIDPWWQPLKEADERKIYDVVSCASGAKMPLPSNYFNTVVSNSVLEHIPDIEPVIGEVERVLKPGGWFYFCVPGPNFRRFLSVARLLDAAHLPGAAESYRLLFDRIARHYYYSSPEEWTARMERHGLQVHRWWSYFSKEALTMLEWWHPLGLPSVINKKIKNDWGVLPPAIRKVTTEALLRPYYEESLPREGAYLFFIVRKPHAK